MGEVSITNIESKIVLQEAAFMCLERIILASEKGYLAFPSHNDPTVEYRIYIDKQWEDESIYFRVVKYSYLEDMKNPN